MKRVRKWTKAEKEWLGYKRKLANNNMEVSLSKAPWANGEQHDEHDEKGREGMELSSEEQTSRKRRGSKRV